MGSRCKGGGGGGGGWQGDRVGLICNLDKSVLTFYVNDTEVRGYTEGFDGCNLNRRLGAALDKSVLSFCGNCTELGRKDGIC
jgi:hypothetical protein